MVGNAYLVLEKNCGSGAALGFLITLQLLRTWMAQQNDGTWFDSQCEAVSAMGSIKVGEYVIAYINDPALEIRRLSELLTTNKSPLRAFILYSDTKWTSFGIGAYLLIGLLLHAESSSHRDDVVLVV